MEKGIQRYTLRIEASLLDKIRYIAKYEGRSANKEIEQTIKRRIASFEKANGEITEALMQQ
jgi:hypothetical protein